MRIVEGMIVYSDAGHDKDRFGVVLKLDGRIATIADGKLRTLTKPKRKNVKHLKPTAKIVDLAECCTDKKLRAICWPYQYGGEQPETLKKGGSTLV